MENFIDAVEIKGEFPGLAMISGLSLCIDGVSDGRVLPFLRSSTTRPKYQIDKTYESPEWMNSYIGRDNTESFELEVDGAKLENHWKLKKVSSESRIDGSVLGSMEIDHETAGITVVMHSIVNGTAFFERWLEIKNNNEKPARIAHVSPVSGILWAMVNMDDKILEDIYELGYYSDSRPGYEGCLTWKTLPEGCFEISSRTGCSGWGTPCCYIRNKHNGEYFAVSLEWSSNWRFKADVIPRHDQKQLALTFSIGPSGSAPIYVMQPGETVSSPHAHFGLVRGGMDACANEFHSHIRKNVLHNRCNTLSLPLTCGRVVEGGFDWLKHEVDMSASAGMECFLIDAGWYGYGHSSSSWYDSTGDWCVGEWMDDGLDRIREYIHSKGMSFGLWIELEAAGRASVLAKEHPEWLAVRDDKPLKGGRLLDLARPEVNKYVENEMLRIIDQYKPDVLKIDYNMGDVGDSGENLVYDSYENSMWRHTEALYEIFEKVREKYPGLYLENCAGGGGRNDLGMLRRFDICNFSDDTTAPRSLIGLYNMTYALPPETLRYYFSHSPGYHLYGDLDFQMRAALMANPLFVGFGAKGDPVNLSERECILHYVGIYKDFIRPLMKNCKVYHHTGHIDLCGNAPFLCIEYTNDDHRCAVVWIFRLRENAKANEFTVYPKCVSFGKTYSITQDSTGFTYTSDSLTIAHHGFTVRMDGGFTSEMLLIREVKE